MSKKPEPWDFTKPDTPALKRLPFVAETDFDTVRWLLEEAETWKIEPSRFAGILIEGFRRNCCDDSDLKILIR
jgi:hypothetical protein